MKFDYKKVGGGRVRPFIPVEMRNLLTGKAVKCYALVDSGADTSLFDPMLAGIIGLKVEQGEKREVTGVIAGQSRTYYVHDVEMVVGGWVFQTQVGFMQDLASNGNGLVGQTGFFDKFKFVKFDAVKGSVELGALSGLR